MIQSASAAQGQALIWEALGFLSGNAFSTAAMVLVGQNLGLQRHSRRPAAAGRRLRWAAVSCA